MLDGKNAAELTNEVGAGNPNQAAMPNVKPEITKLSAIFPSKEALPKLQQLQDSTASNVVVEQAVVGNR